VLLRGPRAYQYADGFGGVGYYETAGDRIDPDIGERAAEQTSPPLVRVGYVHVDPAAPDESVRVALQTLSRYSQSDSVMHFGEEPAGEG